MADKKCKYCGVEAEEVGYEDFDNNVCPVCAKKKPLYENKVTLRKSNYIDLSKLSYYDVKDGTYMEVTEWANEEGIDIEIISSEGEEIKRFNLSYVEYEALANMVHSFGSFEPVIYTERLENED